MKWTWIQSRSSILHRWHLTPSYLFHLLMIELNAVLTIFFKLIGSKVPFKLWGVGSHFLLQGIFPTQTLNPCLCSSCIAGGLFTCWAFGESEIESEVAQSCPTLCDPMDCSLLGFSVHGIFQARILEWVAISFSRGSSQPKDRTQVSCIAGRRFILWATREALSNSNTPQFYTCDWAHNV